MMRQMMNQLAGADAVHIRHLNIHQDQIHLQPLGLVHGLLAAVAEDHLLHKVVQQGANQLQVSRIVVDGHHGHRQLMAVGLRQRRGSRRMIGGHQRRQQAGGSERFQQAGSDAVALQGFGADLGMTWQSKQHVVRHRAGFD